MHILDCNNSTFRLIRSIVSVILALTMVFGVLPPIKVSAANATVSDLKVNPEFVEEGEDVTLTGTVKSSSGYYIKAVAVQVRRNGDDAHGWQVEKYEKTFSQKCTKITIDETIVTDEYQCSGCNGKNEKLGEGTHRINVYVSLYDKNGNSGKSVEGLQTSIEFTIHNPELTLNTPALISPSLRGKYGSDGSSGYFWAKYSKLWDTSEDHLIKWEDVGADYYALDIIILKGDPDPTNGSEKSLSKITSEQITKKKYTISSNELTEYGDKWVKVCIQPMMDNGDYGWRGMYYFKLTDPSIPTPIISSFSVDDTVTMGDAIECTAEVDGNGGTLATVSIGIRSPINSDESFDAIYLRNTNIGKSTYSLNRSIQTGGTISGTDESGNAKTMSMAQLGTYSVTLYAINEGGTTTASLTHDVTLTEPVITAPTVVSVSHDSTTIYEDTDVTYTIKVSGIADKAVMWIDSYEVATITNYSTSGNYRIFTADVNIQNPGTRVLKAVAYNGTTASDPYTMNIVVEEADLPKLNGVTIKQPENGSTLTKGDSLLIKWNTPTNVSSVDNYIVKVWSDVSKEYTYTKNTTQNSVNIGSSCLQDVGSYSVSITAIKSGYEPSESIVYFSVTENAKTLPTPTITSPNSYGSYDAGKNLTFSWSKVNGATKYYYDIRDITDGEPGTSILSGSTQNKTVTVPGNTLLAGHVIYLSVYAWSSDDESEEAYVYAVIVKSDVSINVSVDRLDFDSEADNETVKLTSSDSWTATANESWITLDKYSGSSDSNVKISVSKNATDKIRWGFVEFEDSTGSVIVEIYQATSSSAYIRVDTDTVRFDAKRGISDNISITSNLTWKITSDSEWLFASRTSGTYDADISLIAEANNSAESRTGLITISSGSISETITVIQEGGSTPTISDFTSSYIVELGNDVPLQGVIEAVGNGKLKKVTIKCNNSGGSENTAATVDLKLKNTGTFNLADLKFATTNSNIFSGTGEYTFIIYASADNFTVTDNSIGSFTVTVTTTQASPSVIDKGVVDLKGTSLTLTAAIENYGSGTFEVCGFDLYDANGDWITTYTHTRPTNNSNSFQRKVTGLIPETKYYYCPFIKTSEGTFPATDNRSLVEFTTAKAVQVQGIELVDGNGITISTDDIYGTNGDTLTFGVKTANNVGDIKNTTWLSSNSAICSVKSSTNNACTVLLNGEGESNFSITVTDYYGNEFSVEICIHIYNAEYVYKLSYSDSLSNAESGIVLHEHDFAFSSTYFENPSTYYNHNLAKLSFGLILAGQTTTNKDLNDGNETAENRTATIKGMYEAYGFESVKAYNYDEPLSDDNDKIAYTIAQKDISANNEQYKLIVIATRGGNYGAEWVSNLNVGRHDTGHNGFYTAADNVVKSFKAYCSEENIDISANVKVLITGFSRSATTSNIVAHDLNKLFESSGNSKENVYAYTFATPKNTLTNDAQSLVTGYENIFNIVSSDDFVPYVPLGTWGFSRYGTTLYLPKYGTSHAETMLNTLDELIAPNENVYRKNSNGFPFQNWSEQSKGAKQTEIFLRYAFGDLDEFRNEYQNVVRDVVEIGFDGEGKILSVIDIALLYAVVCSCVPLALSNVGIITAYNPGNVFTEYLLNKAGFNITLTSVTVPLENLIPGLVDAFESRSHEQQNLIVEFLTGRSMDDMISYLETFICAKSYWISHVGEDNPYEEMLEQYPPIRLGDHITATHRMETYLAWIESADAKTLFSSSFDMYNITVACPVNINIYDADAALVGRVVNDEIDTSFDLSDSIELSVTDDVKTISIYDDSYYRFEIIPISEGNMTVTINGTSTVNSGVYENINLKTDSEYQLIPTQANNGSISYELIDGQSDVCPVSEIDNDILIMVKCTSEGNGHSVGGGFVAYNEYVTLTAVPHGNDTFIGWYLNDVLVSTETSYSFFATQSIKYTAKFTVSSYTITGTVTSSDSNTKSTDDDTVTITLANDDNTYQTTVTSAGINNTVEYSIENVVPGTYTMTVSKSKHATREYTVTVVSEDVVQNAIIRLYGDVTDDGYVNMTDVTQIKRYCSGKTSIFGTADTDTEEYRLVVANVYTDDGVINMTDVTQIKRYCSGKTSIFDYLP